MKLKLIVSASCGLAVCAAGFNAQAANTFNMGADLELDITNQSNSDSDDTLGHSGGIRLNATGESKKDGYFVKGVAQPKIPFSGDSVGYDDVFLQFGNSQWDVQLGRFEATNLFPKGMDKVVVNAGGVDVYEANKARGRKNNALHAALHFNASESVKFELGAMLNKDGDTQFSAIRPAIVFKVGSGMTFHAGLENITDDANSTDQSGFGIGGSFALAGGTLNASAAKLTEEVTGSPDKDVTSTALNYSSGPWGLGYLNSTSDNGSGTDPSVSTFYGAYTVSLLGLDGASMTFAASTSSADNVATNDSVNALRLRFNYSF